LAREKGWFLAWDDANWLYLINRNGERQAQRHFDGGLNAGCCSDDGSTYVALGNRGEIYWLAPDLTTRWERTLPHTIVAGGVDSFGGHLALSDGQGNLHLLNRVGEPLSKISTPRPLRHLTFATTAALLFATADFGLVACFDLKGQWLWRDGLVAHVGSLCVNGAGDYVVLACYSEGLCRYGNGGAKLTPFALPEPCRLASQSFDGQLLLGAGQTNRIYLVDAAGQTLSSHALEARVAALALGPLGDYAIAAGDDGLLVGLDLRNV
jgi:hypothetical protein